MARQSPLWLARLLRRADEWLSDYSIPTADHRTLATRHPAPQPATSADMAADEDNRGPIPATPTYPASVA